MKKNIKRKCFASKQPMIYILLVSLFISNQLFAFTKQKAIFGFRNAPVELVIKKVEKLFEVQFTYNETVVKGFVKIDLPKKERTLEETLQQLSKLTGWQFLRSGNMVGIQSIPSKESSIQKNNQEKITIKGKVTDNNKQPVPGATIAVKGMNKGEMTDANGNFSIEVEKEDVLVISYLGFTSQQVIAKKSTTLNIVLLPLENNLEEVVVTALGIKRQEKALGYSSQKVEGASLQTVKGVDIGTSLTGKVSGLVVRNSTEFNGKPQLLIRGEAALLVIDGVPYGNLTLRDIPTDDIEKIDFLKGPTAAALYGSRGQGGVMLITTKKGASGKGLSIDVNSSTMFQTGFLAIPETQSSYGRGSYGSLEDDYVWGPKLDVGTTAMQWNPVTKQMEDLPLVSSGKNNLKNFMQTGLVTNNNFSIAQSGDAGSFRVSLNQIHNKGQFPNQQLNMLNFTVGGEIKASDKFTLESHVGISRRTAPQVWGSGYNNQGYLYQLTMWTGADYDIRQYKDYWEIPNKKQNWGYNNWYDNPYLIAYEKLNGIQQNTINANFTANYNFSKDLKLMLRVGYDVYTNEETKRNPTANIFSTRGGWNAKGLYNINKTWGWSTSDDLILTYDKKVDKWGVNALGGATVYRYVDQSLFASTKNGLTSPTFYSLNGSVEQATVSPGYSSRQVNSLYASTSFSWNNAVFLDATGRNDWNSSQPKAERSFFYPSLGSSIVLSELVKLPEVIDMFRIRGSWALSKTVAEVYAINRPFSTTNVAWNTLNSASYPSGLLGDEDLKPSAFRTWEIGTAAYLFKKRLHVDLAYFNKYYYNQQRSVLIPASSGFSSTLINTKETSVRKGFELTVDGTIIKKANFEWQSTINWSNNHFYYGELDPVYSAKSPFVKKGLRRDAYTDYYWLRDPSGNLIHDNSGYTIESDYVQKYGNYDADFSFGFINNFRIGSFNVGLNIDGRIGGLLFNSVEDKMWDSGTHPGTINQYRYDEAVNGLQNYVGQGVKVTSGSVVFDSDGAIVSDDRVYAPNDTELSYQDYTQWTRGGGYGVEKASFVKLREVSVGYVLPSKILGKIGVKSASVTLTAQNVFLVTKFKFSDPDIGSEDLNSPSQRMVGMNVKLGF